MTKVLITLALLLNIIVVETSLAQGQTNQLHWSFKTNYSRSMTVSVRASVDGVLCEGSQWECAAFIDDECRYSQLLQYHSRSSTWVAYISVQFNQEDIGKLVTFRLYNHETGKESIVTKKLEAETNAKYGLIAPDYDYYLLEADTHIEKLFKYGEGTPESPYLLENKADFFAFARYVTEYSHKVCVKMTNDIDLEKTPWSTIGVRATFTGTLDGNGHTLKNLYVDNRSGGVYAAMFGQLAGTVKNLTILDGTILAGKNNYSGMIAGNLSGTIRNVLCSGEIRSTDTGECIIGGIAGYMYSGELTRSAFVGTIHSNSLCGGLLGTTILNRPQYYHIDSCYFYGSITNSSGQVGSIIGHQSATIGRSIFYNSERCPYEVYATIDAAANGPQRGDAGRTEAAFKTGEVAYKMGWGQDLSKLAPYPMPLSLSEQVYQIKKYKGKTYSQISYVNHAPEEVPANNAIYLCDPEIPDYSGENIVYKQNGAYYCPSFRLTDADEFYTPVSFTAETARYTRQPNVWADGSNGWETIILPFTANQYEASLSGKIVPFWNKSYHSPSTADNLNKNGKFWIKKHSNSETGADGTTGKVYFDYLRGAPSMIANTPYIIAIPGNSFGSNSLEGQTITFSATDVVVHATPGIGGIAIGDFAFQGTYTPIVSKALVLNDQGNLFMQSSEGHDVAPLQAYFEHFGAYPHNIRSLSIGSDKGGATGFSFEQRDPGTLSVQGGDGCIFMKTSETVAIHVVTTDGRTILTQNVEAGNSRFDNLPQGVYLVNNIKVFVK